jgi:glycosyltransferase involved in cell wall biosynthesis
MVSIVIPAHNESAVIARCLAALTAGADPGELEIVVVANGCTDDTADRARAFGHPDVRVIETDVGSKTHALNLGDAATTAFPRFYVDADVVLTTASIRAMAAELAAGRFLAVAPLPEIDLTGCTRAVRAFYRINQRLPSSAEGIGGSGVYGLSREGRARFGEFPRITADDGFVRVHFKPEERLTLANCRSIVSAPRTFSGLLAIKSRSHMGSYELRQLYPDLWKNRGMGNRRALLKMAKLPTLWPSLLVYAAVKVVSRLRARTKIRAGKAHIWERDETSRTTHAVTKS